MNSKAKQTILFLLGVVFLITALIGAFCGLGFRYFALSLACGKLLVKVNKK
jgi:hypothetical protein